MITIRHRRLSVSSPLIGLLLFLIASSTQAAFVFTDDTINISYSEPGLNLTDAVVAGTGLEISYLDGSNIGNNIMLDFEYIDIGDTTITFNLRGDGPDHTKAGYQKTGLVGSYVISLAASNLSISNLSLGTVTDIDGVSLGSVISYDAKNIYFDISTLGILEKTPGADIGSLTMNVELVPVPAALPLLLSGLAGLLAFSYRRRAIR
jgi:hypothetical protein